MGKTKQGGMTSGVTRHIPGLRRWERRVEGREEWRRFIGRLGPRNGL
jgi:hypothetical protein